MKTLYAHVWANGNHRIRSHVATISTMDSSSFVVRRVTACVTGTMEVCPCFERGKMGADLGQHIATLGGLDANSNVSAAVVMTMELVIAGWIADIIRDSGKEVVVCSCGECGGTTNTICRVVRYAKEFVTKTSEQKRVEIPISELMLGMECGGSDSVSDLINNPVTGMVADKVVDEGGRIALSETTEWMGVEESLRIRTVTSKLDQCIADAIKRYKDYIISIGVDIKDMNPTPGNIKGGSSTIEERALGAVKKGDIKPVQDLITYNGKVSHRGLTLLDAFPDGVESTTSLTSIGYRLTILSTGKDNPIGDLTTPIIKVTGNARTVDSYSDNIDVNTPVVMTEGMELSEADDLLYEHMLEYCDGKLATAEVLGDTEVAVTWLRYTV